MGAGRNNREAGRYIADKLAQSGVSVDGAARMMTLRFDGRGAVEAADAAMVRNELIMLISGYPGDYGALVRLLSRFVQSIEPEGWNAD